MKKVLSAINKLLGRKPVKGEKLSPINLRVVTADNISTDAHQWRQEFKVGSLSVPFKAFDNGESLEEMQEKHAVELLKQKEDYKKDIIRTAQRKCALNYQLRSGDNSETKLEFVL